MNPAYLSALPGFLLVGAIGFLTDGGTLALLVHRLGLEPLPSRLLSLPLAMTVTWALNRRFVFPSGRWRRAGREYLAYLGAQAVGALANLGVFSVLVSVSAWMACVPLVPFALASALAMGLNFLVLRHCVYR